MIVFDGGSEWTYWARRALFLANQVWGGVGFALVPHRDGVVDPALLHACRAYDPDYVVAFGRTLSEIDHFEPGKLQIRGADGAPLTGADRAAALARADREPGSAPSEADTRARDVVSSVCSPYQFDSAEPLLDDVFLLDCPSPSFPAAIEVPGAHQGHVLQCPPSWDGLLGVAIASKVGMVEPPDLNATTPPENPEASSELTRWLLGQPAGPLPRELLWFPNGIATGVLTEQSRHAFDRTMAGLTRVTSTTYRDRIDTAVLGDTAEDFALARLRDLTYGRTVWLPSILGTEDVTLAYPIVAKLHGSAGRSRGWKHEALTITSVSRPHEEVIDFRERLVASAAGTFRAESAAADGVHVIPAVEADWPASGFTHVAVQEQFDDVLPVPTFTDETGTTEMVAPLPAPSLNDAALAAHRGLAWQVDVTWAGSHSIRGRRVVGSELFGARTHEWLTMARASRSGISHRAERFDFVPAGTQTVNQLARPTLRNLSLAGYVNAKAAEHDMTTRVSDAGQRTAQLTRMLGGRREFASLFGGPLLPALHDLLPASSSVEEAYPDGRGVVLRVGEGVLSFDGFVDRTDRLSDKEVRGELDRALRARVLRRGLVLRCAVCQSKQFLIIDKVAQTWRCERCDSGNELDHSAWHHSTCEPAWFYGLHPVAQHLLRDHGDVVALLSARLSAPSQGRPVRYQDLMELEFLKDNEPQVEVDLIAYREDALIVAECKYSDDLGGGVRVKRRAEIDKKCRAAAWVQADQLVFATTASAWKPSAVGAISAAVRGFEGWSACSRPAVRLITGLGTNSSHEEVIRPGS
ncbi:hypothetical protein [Amycolatopsis sp. CFH S0078]|uniref:hypothetical protein n=1 Tax=Amycolatopsis sp. CFH S0078 TaxID=1644108 RepID=UPI00106EB816|nr:hypothetical protein [Amycolatopsis sp. CFH S0078]